MVNLTDLGFSKDTIAETIVSTYNKDGKPNAAPMGIIMEDETQVLIKIFNSSSTYQNLQLNRFAVINLISNVEVFYRTAFKEINLNESLPPEWFTKSQTANAPLLRMADAVVEVSIADMKPIDSEKTQATCIVKFVRAETVFPKVYCRAFAATIEAIIHATRVKAFAGKVQEQQHVSKLLTLIDNCKEVIGKTAPNSSYSKIMEDLTKRIDSWMANK